MSCVGWEKGTLVLPPGEAAMLKAEMVEEVNNFYLSVRDRVGEFHEWMTKDARTSGSSYEDALKVRTERHRERYSGKLDDYRSGVIPEIALRILHHNFFDNELTTKPTVKTINLFVSKASPTSRVFF